MSLELTSIDLKLSNEDLAVIEALHTSHGKTRSEYLREIIRDALEKEVNTARLIDQLLIDNGFNGGIRR